ncbi:sensor histidine kinase [Nocardioides stalactiti]|uniref:sensor histidine kinase n=1 Tax=Nocardioides stalactiti TaxID=2755356 RepID=UPI0015FF2A25|nr:DUF4118 domain-containing protein [Nocardioides stalactiti]
MRSGSLSGRRVGAGYLLAGVGPSALVAVLVPLRDTINLAGDVALFLVLVVAAALVGGLGPALVSSAVAVAALNFFFTPPFHTLAVNDPSNVVALAAFVVVGVMVSWLVDVAERRAQAAAAGAQIEAADRLRAALLTAVGHDLRSPLAAAKAAVSGMRTDDVALDERDRDELLEAADGALDRLAGLVDNLLDMSRLQAGAQPVHLRPIAVEDVVARALDYLGVEPRTVLLEVEEDLPDVLVDPGLLERAVANLVANAQRFAPPGEPPVLRVDEHDGAVRLQVVDRGPGIPAPARDQVFQPFQRLGDSGTGLGLGLALSRGLVEAMGGTVTPVDTPGGGLTMVVVLPVGGAS